MARRTKSLTHNLSDGVSVPRHRDHRSKKNQMKGGYKRRKERIMYKNKLQELSTYSIDFE